MLTKQSALVLFLVALVSGFVLGRTTAPQASERLTVGEPVQLDTAHQEMLERYESVTKIAFSDLSFADQRFVRNAMDEYTTECIPVELADANLQPFCHRFRRALRSFNELDNQGRP